LISPWTWRTGITNYMATNMLPAYLIHSLNKLLTYWLTHWLTMIL
jgi:hypothetical protein